MLDHGQVTQRSEPARPGSPSGAREENERLHRKIDQQQRALAHLSEALVGLRRGTQALREENRELRRALEAERGARAAPSARSGGRAHAERTDEIVHRAAS